MIPIDAILTRLYALHPKKIDLSLDRMWRILEGLGHPERTLPPVIHVGGTNGKGSTVAFMRAILEAAGRSVHVYTSPHLVRINERFRLGAPGGGRLASDTMLADAFAECERINGDAPITVFEITTAAGLLLFARNPADVLLLEVGLGGRLDATNVVEKPVATAIAPVSIDHVDFLGDTVAMIASEKAGIFKPGAPAVLGPQPPEALTVLERAAMRVGAPLSVAGEHWTVGEEHGRLVYQDDDGLLDLPAPRLPGRHQFENAGLAIATLRSMSGWSLPVAAYEQGVAAADWPARMQRLPTGPLAALTPEGSELWLDGGHNPAAGRMIAAAVADIEERAPKPLILVVGMLSTKDVDGFLQHFAGLARRVIAIPIPGQEKTVPPETIADAARRAGMHAETQAGVADALARVAQLKIDPPPRILIAGSLYLAGAVLAASESVPM
jgi:dihydrofolate synthase / folylpolyglutamate synthase